MFDALGQDLHYALRQLRRAPLFTLVASLSVALGVIVAVSAFSLLNALLFKPLPVRDPDNIVHVYTSDYDGRKDPWGSSSYRDYQDFQSSGAFTALAASSLQELAVSVADQAPVQQFASFVSGNYFEVLGLRMWRGRPFSAGAAMEIVLNYPYWQRVFGGDDRVIGQTLRVNSQSLTIVGVAPESYRGISLGPPVVGWIPTGVMPTVARNAGVLMERGSRGFAVFGWLQPGQSRVQASQRLNALAVALSEQEPDSWLDRNREVRLVSLLPHEVSTLPPRSRGALLLGVGLGALLIAFIVLLACTNVAALMLGRAAGRESEIALRLTLGASRARLVRQLFTESFLLAAIGGALSVAGLYWTLSLVRRIPMVDVFDLRPDWRVLAAAAGTSVMCALVFGLAPVLHSLRVDLRARISGGTRQKNRMRGLLITLQVAAASVLILLASSAVRGVRTYVNSDPGVELDGLVYIEIDTRLFGDDTARSNLYQAQVKQLLATTPGVRNAASTALVPLGQSRTHSTLGLPNGEKHEIELNIVGADFFATVGLRALRGRTFQPTDRRGSAPVALVNRAFLRRYGDALLGQTVNVSSVNNITIVGEVPEIHYRDPRLAPQPMVYMLDEQMPWYSSRKRFLLRTVPGNEQMVVTALRQQLRQRFPEVVIPAIEPLRDFTTRQTLPHRIAGRVALATGGVELLLASIGLYGLLLFALLARRREIGVRLALGATPREASWAVMRDGMRYVVYGAAAGIVLGIPATMVAQQAVPGARMSDPAPFIAAMAAVITAVALAAWLPARKAGRVEPAVALRQDG